MTNNPYVNKVQKADGTAIMDISDTTAVASDVAQGKYFYLKTGQKVQGSNTSGGYITQDQNGYVVLSPTNGVPTLISKTITESGTYSASTDGATGYSNVTVNVSGGLNTTTNCEVDTRTWKTLTVSNIQSEPSKFELIYDNAGTSSSFKSDNNSVWYVSYDGATTTVRFTDASNQSYTLFDTLNTYYFTWSYSSSQHTLTFTISSSASSFYFNTSGSSYGYGYTLYYA